MNKIHKYKDFLNESKSTRESISEEIFTNILRTNCKKYKHVRYNHSSVGAPVLLMRATKYKGDFTVYSKPDTARNVRLAGLITMMMNKLDSWSKYPNRLLSLIASTDDTYPNIINNWDKDNKVHVVIPFDNAKLAVCTQIDFNLGTNTVGHNQNFDYFVKTYMQVLNFNREYMGPTPVLTYLIGHIESYKPLSEIIKEFNNIVLSDEEYLGNKSRIEIINAVRDSWSKSEGKYKTPFDMFEDAMNPEKNGFRLIEYNGDNNEFSNNEVWTTDNCLLVEYEKYLELVDSGVIPS